ncbi:MAG TPA: invasion associated locus B family protein [Ochrobactrum sp.]|nr:invasion associated locus B family protein [Ochrobactrum sp.]
MTFRMLARRTISQRLATLATGASMALAIATLPSLAQQAPAQLQTPQEAPAAQSQAAPSSPQQSGKLKSQHGAWSVLKTADNKARILRVLAPLGVLLPNGLGLNVDGKDIGRAYFVRCFEDGCYAEVILEDDLLKTLRSGKAATFIVFQTPEEGVGIPVDLKGFGEGFDALP